MKHGQLSGVLLGVVAALASGSSRAEGLRCGDKLASSGSSLYEVRATCGEPDDAQHAIETRLVEERVLVPCPRGSQQRLCVAVIVHSLDVVVDHWTYDFGRNRFIEFAHFEQGALISVTDNGTYGHKDPT